MAALLSHFFITLGQTDLENVLVICEILGVFVNTLTNEDKYPLQKCRNLWPTIQMQLPKKPKTCS